MRIVNSELTPPSDTAWEASVMDMNLGLDPTFDLLDSGLSPLFSERRFSGRRSCQETIQALEPEGFEYKPCYATSDRTEVDLQLIDRLDDSKPISTYDSQQAGQVAAPSSCGSDGIVNSQRSMPPSTASRAVEHSKNRPPRHISSMATGVERHNRSTGDHVLACPFYKKDAHKYRACRKFKLLRMKDVKQHVHRKHMKPACYCPICFETFATVGKRDEHITKRDCQSRPQPYFEGVSEHQRRQLNHYPGRTRPILEQWYDMWEVIFPTETRPMSPYIGDGQEEMMPLIRSLWTKGRHDIVKHALEECQTSSRMEHELIFQVIENVFNQLEAGAGNPEIN
ncbi:hypothetical protein F5Y15DRAFT_334139 [Xylariaceae sp. FL0016]|nr:hypothetical protein F5Y15DRAFT_334139 [Xylariaceae sp. FL0016]